MCADLTPPVLGKTRVYSACSSIDKVYVEEPPDLFLTG